MKQSLGLLEVSGLALAISCADVMAKAASITLVGLEKTNGSGWTVIKITGDVASVHSAIITGASFAEQRDGLVAHKVIARPGEGILARATVAAPAPVPAIIEEPETDVVAEESAPVTASDDGIISCNLCLDPACPRQKGEPRSLCLHSGKRG
ncbi:BMC domain-containing protein [Citrobacter sedlakii]|uniref:BMC domain-containing protein n=1 Tax=Citrobacter sedlakii TaxID=67826 RepID=A0ABS0ZPT7_9ENTR|nr:BMC domain-containing protein [Citrobacter sedlakii]MBJ8380754.1 BMC domain-containing protein [Citrobacter sedlakii]